MMRPAGHSPRLSTSFVRRDWYRLCARHRLFVRNPSARSPLHGISLRRSQARRRAIRGVLGARCCCRRMRPRGRRGRLRRAMRSPMTGAPCLARSSARCVNRCFVYRQRRVVDAGGCLDGRLALLLRSKHGRGHGRALWPSRPWVRRRSFISDSKTCRLPPCRASRTRCSSSRKTLQ